MTDNERKEKMDHMFFLIKETEVLKNRFQPHDTGHLHTAVNVLRHRVQEIRQEIVE